LSRAALLLALVAATACRGSDDRTRQAAAPKAVAIVNGEPITTEALQRELAQSRASGGEGPGRTDVVRQQVLEEMIDRTLLLQQARARSLLVGQDQVERAFLRVRSEYPGTHFDDLLAQERLSQTELKARLRDQLTMEKLFHEEVFPQVQVSDAELQRHYAEHAAEFEEPERVRVLQVVVASREEAQQIRDKLRRDPAKFAEVARKSSIGPEGKNGGDLGYIGRGSGYPEVFDLCFSLPLNALSEVTPSPYGFHLFKVVDRKPAQRRTFEQARAAISDKLLREKRGKAQQEYVDALRKRAQIKIDQAAVAAVTP
jgi:peptidyl-prolyl cis-trans isomerase C